MTTVADVSPRFKARAVGVSYLVMIALGGIQALAGRLPASSDAAVTAANILSHQSTVYVGFACDLLVVVSYIVVTALLYELFEPVSRVISLLAAFFSLVGCATQACASLFRIAPLTILTAAQSSTGIKKEHVDTLAYLLLKLYSPAYGIALIFFASYLVVIGWLIFRSTFMPRLLGAVVAFEGIAWLPFLWPPLAKYLFRAILVLAGLGEGSLVLWLLIVGVNVERWHALRARAERTQLGG